MHGISYTAFFTEKIKKDTDFMKNHFNIKLFRSLCLTTAVVLLTGMFFSLPLKALAEAEKTDKYLSIGIYEDGAVTIEKDDEEIHEWGGSSALFVMLSLMQLKEEGLIDEDKPVTDYMPDEVSMRFLFSYPVTVNNILNHTTGLQDASTGQVMLEGERFTSLADVLANNMPRQNFKSGDYVSYSDWGITLGAYLVECVSGKSYPEYVHEKILKPLGMEHTSVLYDYSDCEYVAKKMSEKTNVKFGFYPAYSSCGTMEDFMILMEDLAGGKSKILKSETVSELSKGTLLYRGTDIPRISNGLAFYYEYESPCLGLRSNNYNSVTHFYIDVVNHKAVVIVDKNPSDSQGIFESKKYLGRNDQNADKDSFSYNISQMEGFYLKAGATVRGKSSFLSLMDGVTFKAFDDHGLSVSSNPKEAYLTQISENGFVSEAGDMGYFYTDGANRGIIQYPLLDLVPYPKALNNLRVLLSVFYYLSLVYSFGALLVGLVSFISRKAKKGKKPPAFRKFNLITCGTVLFHGIVFMVMIMTFLMGINNQIANVATMMFFFGTLISFIYIVFLIRTGRKENCSKNEKIGYFATAVACVATILFSFVFHLMF